MQMTGDGGITSEAVLHSGLSLKYVYVNFLHLICAKSCPEIKAAPSHQSQFQPSPHFLLSQNDKSLKVDSSRLTLTVFQITAALFASGKSRSIVVCLQWHISHQEHFVSSRV